MRSSKSLSCVWHETTFELFPEKAVFWPAESALLVADLHLGKAATFRYSGMPVPEGSDQDDLKRLSRLLDQTQAKRLIILGDLLHSFGGMTDALIDSVAQWRDAHRTVSMDCVIGNHDLSAGGIPDAWNINNCGLAYTVSNFRMQHKPETTDDTPCFAGHIHPVVAFQERNYRRKRFPCFVFQERMAILPSFGSMTGGYTWIPDAHESIFPIVEDHVISSPVYNKAIQKGSTRS